RFGLQLLALGAALGFRGAPALFLRGVTRVLRRLPFRLELGGKRALLGALRLVVAIEIVSAGCERRRREHREPESRRRFGARAAQRGRQRSPLAMRDGEGADLLPDILELLLAQRLELQRELVLDLVVNAA